ncbi:hypothetical protein BU15DRAFT_63325 [Melanogaster broomeanus]|nr:hypothetical protein BU15DRAFT_63325 [Melanogaster broomeanus]
MATCPKMNYVRSGMHGKCPEAVAGQSCRLYNKMARDEGQALRIDVLVHDADSKLWYGMVKREWGRKSYRVLGGCGKLSSSFSTMTWSFLTKTTPSATTGAPNDGIFGADPTLRWCRVRWWGKAELVIRPLLDQFSAIFRGASCRPWPGCVPARLDSEMGRYVSWLREEEEEGRVASL